MSLSRFWKRQRRGRELANELETHLAHEIDENIAAGMSPDQARLAAIRKLGNRTRIREDVYRMNTIGWLETLARDARFALRGFRKSPGFTAVALLSLMLGIGATTAIFSVIYGVLIEPYPYKNPHEIWAPLVQDTKTGRPNMFSFYPMTEYLQLKNLPAFADIMATRPEMKLLTGEHSPESLSTILLTGNAFNFIGVEPVIGRTIQPDDVRGSEFERVAVLSYRAWQRLFNGGSDALGKKLVLNDEPYTVIGVMPPRFGWWTGDGVWLPLPEDTRIDGVGPIMRLKSGVSDQIARDQLHEINLQFAAVSPDHYPKSFRTMLRNYMDVTVASGTMQTSLRLLFCAVGFLLLIACANVANLQLARSTARVREIAVRLSIGAGRGRLFRQLLTESVMLALLGGVLGVLFAIGATHAIVALMPDYMIPNEARITVNSYVLLFSLAVSVLTGILFGLVPALQSSRPDLTLALKEATRGSGGSRGGERTRSALVVAEVALSMILLAGAGLTIRSFVALRQVDVGFQPERILMINIPMSPARYNTLALHNQFARQIVEGAATIPGAEAVTIGTGGLPFGGPRSEFAVDGVAAEDSRRIIIGMVGSGYLETLGIPLLRGREITEQEIQRGESVVMINEAATRLWPAGENPVGRHLRIDLIDNAPPEILRQENPSSTMTVVGVIGNTRNDGLRNDPAPAAFVPYTMLGVDFRTLAVRTRLEPAALLNAVRQRVQAVDPQQPVSRMRTIEEIVGFETVQPRFIMALFSFFAAMGLILAVAGIYSILSYQVTQRTHEIGVRMALGARSGDVQGYMLRIGARLILAGLAIGIAGTLALGRFVESELFGVRSTDVLSISSVALLLAVVAFLSAYIPARKASRVDPLIALRHD